MNTERMKILRDAVVANERFCMSNEFTYGGLASCVVGSAWLLASNEERCRFSPCSLVRSKTVRKWLGITTPQYKHIMLGQFSSSDLRDISKQETLIFLDECISAGRVIMRRAGGAV
jgi:hypothetical protein